MTASEGLKRLVQQARADANFFHELVFNPEKAIAKAKYLDPKTKASLRLINAELLLRNLLPDRIAECGDTCGAGSCTDTCGSGSCIGTCSSSCGGTCGSSCDKTSGYLPELVLDEPMQPGGVIVAGGVKAPVVKTRSRTKSRR